MELRHLKSEDFITYTTPGSVVHDAVTRACHAAGFMPHSIHTAQGTAVLLALVAGARAVPLTGVLFRDLHDAGSIDLALAWRSGENNPAVPTVVTAIEAGLLADDLVKGLV